MDALVIAGGIPQPDEPLYAYTRGEPKAMLDIHGKPIIQWVLDAISGASQVENVVVIGLAESSRLTCSKPVTYLPNQVGMIENIISGINQILEIHPNATKFLLATSDIPGITSEMVDWEIEATQDVDVDLCYFVVKREVIEQRYPGSRRTFTRLTDAEVCGADLHVLHTSIASLDPEIYQRLIASRKNPLKQAAILGFDTLLFMLMHTITLDKAVDKITARLHITGRAMVSPYAEIAMDVDKPHQLEMMREDLAKKVVH